MLTKTSKTVLFSLSEVVEKLIQVIAQCESQKAPVPDLRELSGSVLDQVRNLVAVADKITAQATADELLKKEMPKACKLALDSVGALVTASQELVKDPTSNAHIQKLMDGVRGLFTGTSSLLDAFDSAELRKILSVSKAIQETLSTILSHHLNALTQEVFVSKVSVASQSLVQLTQLCHKRSTELLTEELEIELKNRTNTLRITGPSFVSACKLLFADRQSTHAFNVTESICCQIVATCKAIEEIVQKDTDVKQIEEEEENISKLNIAQIKTAPRTAAVKYMRQLANVSAKKLHRAKVLHRQIKDLEKNRILSHILEETEQQVFEFNTITAAYEDSSNPFDAAVAGNKSQSIYNRMELLDAAVSEGIVEQMVRSASETIRLLKDLSVKKDERKSFIEHSTEFNQLVKYAHDKSVENNLPLLALDLKLGRDKVSAGADHLLKLSTALHQKPENEVLQTMFANSQEPYVDDIKQILNLTVNQEGIFRNSELIKGKGNYLRNQLSKLLEACKNNDDTCIKYLSESVSQSGKAIAVDVQREMNNIGFPEERKAQVQSAIDILLQDLNNASALCSVTEPLTATSIQEIHSLGQKMINSLSTILDRLSESSKIITPEVNKSEETVVSNSQEIKEAPTVPNEKEIQKLSIQQAEVVQLLSEEEAALFPIKAVGTELKAEVAQWVKEENPILSAIEIVSLKLIEMSHYHSELEKVSLASLREGQSLLKSQLIGTAQSILSETLKIINHAKPLAQQCTDKILSKQLSSILTRIETLSQQLKIVAAVKASSPTDRDKGAQLINGAHNLVQSLKSCLRHCESAALRIPNGCLKFRKFQ